MRNLVRVAVASLAVAGLATAASAQGAGKNCIVKASEGTNSTEEGAKFQAHEALFQAVDWGLWATWMANGSTPGYDVAKPKFSCKKGGGLGYVCRAQTTFCKKG
jgi:hypothetical protein